MGSHDRRRDRQAEARPAACPGSSVLEGREPFEDALAVGDRDSRPVVADDELDHPVQLAHRERYGAPRVPSRVRRQVLDQPAEVRVTARDLSARDPGGVDAKVRRVLELAGLTEHQVVGLVEGQPIADGVPERVPDLGRVAGEVLREGGREEPAECGRIYMSRHRSAQR